MPKKLPHDGYHLSQYYRQESAGRYNIPKLKKEFFIPPRLIDFTQALNSKDFDAGILFFIDDSRFERIWKSPSRYLPMLKRFSCVCTPDFSIYRDMPLAMKIWNIYRSRLLGQIMQHAGIRVIPTLSWADKDTYSFCFSGIEHFGVVAISTLGTFRSTKAQSLFHAGCQKLCTMLKPKTILIYGKLPDYNFTGINIIQYKYVRYDWKKQKNKLY